MLRDASLIPLSHQHQHGLALCVLTDRALREDPGPKNVAAQATRIIDRYEVELANHFQVEEDFLFPACECELTSTLIDEHRRMEGLVGDLRSAPSLELVRTFIELLRTHIRREENELFQQIQRDLPRQKLDEVGEKIESNVIRVCL